MSGPRTWLLVAFLVASGPTFAQPGYLRLDERTGPAPQSVERRYPFVVHASQTKLYYNVDVALTDGLVSLRLLAPDGTLLHDFGQARTLTAQGSVPTPTPGTYELEAVTDGAVGKWKAQVCPLLPGATFYLDFVGASAMVLVALAAAFYWRAHTHAHWRWFWAGAGVWTVGVALKFAFALPLNEPILGLFERNLPPTANLIAGSVYIGLLTGIFEIGVTLATALIWRKLAADAPRAIAVGVGAGAFEALLLGLLSLVAAVVVVSGAGPDVLLAQSTQATLSTPLDWLVGPVERMLAILCHTSSRALVPLTVATRRWRYFGWGFLLLTLIDSIAGLFLLGGKVLTISTWWIELSIVPVAVASVPIIRWCVRRWPTAALPVQMHVMEVPFGGPTS